MFIDVSGEVFKIVLRVNDGAWIISYENPCTPKGSVNFICLKSSQPQ